MSRSWPIMHLVVSYALASIATSGSTLRSQQRLGVGSASNPRQHAPTEATQALLELMYVEGWCYTTSLSLGNPPQTFTAALDINWSDIYVPSVQCLQVDRPEYCAPHPLFDEAASTTFVDARRNVTVDHFGYHTRGNAANDSVHVGGLEILDLTFEQAYMFRPGYFFDDTSYDTALPLARKTVQSEASDLQVPSVFQGLQSQELLEANLFCITLPRKRSEVGQVAIGAIPAKVSTAMAAAEPAILPLRETSNVQYSKIHVQSETSSSFDVLAAEGLQYLSGGWEVAASSMTFGTGSEALTLDLSNYTVIFSTMEYWLSLPSSFARQIRSLIGVDVADGSVECSKRDAGLPNLDISFQGVEGRLHNFSMTAADYVRTDVKLPFVDPSLCIVPIALHEEGTDNQFVLLGNTFMQKNHFIFDADQRIVTIIERDD